MPLPFERVATVRALSGDLITQSGNQKRLGRGALRADLWVSTLTRCNG